MRDWVGKLSEECGAGRVEKQEKNKKLWQISILGQIHARRAQIEFVAFEWGHGRLEPYRRMHAIVGRPWSDPVRSIRTRSSCPSPLGEKRGDYCSSCSSFCKRRGKGAKRREKEQKEGKTGLSALFLGLTTPVTHHTCHSLLVQTRGYLRDLRHIHASNPTTNSHLLQEPSMATATHRTTCPTDTHLVLETHSTPPSPLPPHH